MLATKPVILGVFGVDTHSYITHDSLGARGSNDGIVALIILMHDFSFVTCRNDFVLLLHVIFEVIEMRVFVVIDDLFVGEGRLALRVPVDHT